MATKTISIELDVYEKLRAARLHPRESFSQVLRRAKWETPSLSASGLLELARERSKENRLLTKNVLDALDELQAGDLPPEDTWGSS